MAGFRSIGARSGAVKGLFRGQDDHLVRLIQRKTDGLSPNEIRQSLKRVDVTFDFPAVNHPADQRLTPLDIPIPVAPEANGKESGVVQHYGVTVNDLIAVGLIRPPFELTATWRNQPFTANIQTDGSILFGSERYTSLSVSAGQARNIANGKPPDGRSYWQTNGWIFWKYRDSETGRMEVLDRLRQRFLQMKRS